MTASPVRRALLSVSDKTGLPAFAAALHAAGVALISTGGTAAALRDAGLPVADVADVTGFPEMMDGRVKTLHPAVHGGVLMLRGDIGHEASAAEHGIEPIDLVVVNLYPFAATVARGAGRDETIENIDIGGPAMVRSAAKNHAHVGVVTDPADYDAVAAEIAAGGLSEATRRRLAGKAFAHTAAYDAAIASWFAFHPQSGATDAPFPATLPLALTRRETMRYGENPHQAAALYVPQTAGAGVSALRLAQGKPLSFNNVNDADGALELIAEFRDAGLAVAIIKHANPCGVAAAGSVEDAYRAARACDPVSAFGGIIAANAPLDGAAARAILELFTEVVIAPDADAHALAAFAAKPNVRLLLGALPDPARGGLQLRTVGGGVLVQTRDATLFDDLKIVTARAPTDAELADMRFAWTVAKHVKSNAIVYAKDGATAGIGAGQMSRLDSARIAAWKARDAAEAAGWPEPRTVGSAAASDAFFPFADGLEAVAAAGATAVIQPGGSIRDADVIAAADRLGIAMAFTGVRHFRH